MEGKETGSDIGKNRNRQPECPADLALKPLGKFRFVIFVMLSPLLDQLALYALAFALPLTYFFYHRQSKANAVPDTVPAEDSAQSKKPLKSIMQAPKDNLAPPKDDPFTTEQLKEFDGSDPSKPIYVAIKGALSVLFSLKLT